MRRDPAIEQVSAISRPWWRRKEAAAPWTPRELQERYTDAIYGYIALRLGVGAEAEDATAETFVAAFTRLHACPTREAITEGDDPTRAYLIGIARRKVADTLRLRERRGETELCETLAIDAKPEQEVLAEEARAQLREILASLRSGLPRSLASQVCRGA